MSSREFTARFHSPVAAVMGQFVQQKQQRQRARFEQLPQTGDLGVETRASLVQRIIDANASANLQRG